MATLRYNADHIAVALYRLMKLAHQGVAETNPS